MIAFTGDVGGSAKKSPFMTLADLRAIAKCWKPPHPKDGAALIEGLMAEDEETKVIHYPGLEPAVIGVVSRYGMEEVLCYSRDRIIAILMLRDGMTLEGAEEFIDFNIEGVDSGPLTPVLLS